MERPKLHPVIESLIRERGWAGLTLMQVSGARAILEGKNVLITAPTGEGKTEAALLPLLSQLAYMGSAQPVAIIYVTPMRALINDLYRRISYWSRPLGFRVAKKHGDVPSHERSARLRNPPHILLITPESLEIDLDWAPRFREYYRNVKAVIVDELHELLSSKRGAQLLLLLERIKELAGDFQRIGLSATLGDPARALEVLSGSSRRPKAIVEGRGFRRFEFSIEYVPDEDDPWPAVVKGAVASISGPTLIFVNSRYVAEKIGHELQAIGLKEVYVHHSSVSADVREAIEQKLRSGADVAVVCTKTLELGIDIGDIRGVLQIRSPGSSSTLLQRAGRSNHSLGGVSRGTVIAVGPVDFAEAIAEANMASLGQVDDHILDMTPIDVIAKEVIGYTLAKGSTTPDEMYKVFRGAKTFNVSYEDFLGLIDYMKRNGVLEESGGRLRVGRAFYKIWRLRDKEGGSWAARDFTDFFSTIPKRDFFTVRSGDLTVGYIDSYFVYRNIRPGDIIRLAGMTWQVIRIDEVNERLEVAPASGAAEIPLWRGEGVERSRAVALEFYKVIFGDENCKVSCSREGLSELARIRQWYVDRGLKVDNDTALLEVVDDEQVLLAPLGSRASETLALVVSYLLMKNRGLDVRYRSSFYGFSVTTGDADLLDLLISIEPSDLKRLVSEALEFAPSFYEEISQARYDVGKLGDLDKEADELFIRWVKEYIISTKLDISGAAEFLSRLRAGRIKVTRVEDPPSPLAKDLLSMPSARPWVQDLSNSIAKALRDWAFTAIELAEELNLPLKSVVSKLKDMRRPEYNSRRVVAFLDVESREWRWTLATTLDLLSSLEEFKESFSPIGLDEEFRLSIRRAHDSEARERLVRPRDVIERWDEISHLIGADEIFELRVASALGEGPTVVYHHVDGRLARLLILNAIAFIQRNPRLGGRVSP